MALKDWQEIFGALGRALDVGLMVGGAVGAGVACGWLIDNKIFHGKTQPWFTLLGIVLGSIAGLKNFIYYAKKLTNKNKKS
ncbi:AtpZ/AtpI family protein [Thermosulfurimonas dismutans]|uniref:ATP synthase protein I n=1 Tax=Thermosulfurimonas dismutans TaxID=999894 RepID=A0A179D6P6_9BACT|nr:AtpZ/AtpI family protein [Thermosulfurimonas dismutans]OAQ21765.1 hypothetical protein TDIS_0283 [Thermosulfurimonas dismutans]